MRVLLLNEHVQGDFENATMDATQTRERLGMADPRIVLQADVKALSVALSTLGKRAACEAPFAGSLTLELG